MLNRLPSQMPPLDVMLADIGDPKPAALAKALDVSARSVRRWLQHGHAPRSAALAIFWLTRWGQNAVHCEAHNAAQLHAGMAAALRSEIDRLQAQLDRLARIGDFGCANDPALGIARPVLPAAPRRRPSVRTDEPSATAPVKPGSTKQPRGFQRG